MLKNARMFRRILSLLLVISLVIPGFAFAQEQPNVDRQKELIEKAYNLVKQEAKKATKDIDKNIEIEDSFKDDDEVRIIVELESKPSIVYATERGIAYSEMSKASIEKIERDIEAEQEAVKARIARDLIDMNYINSYKTVFNGFSGTVKFRDIQRIERIPSVKRVSIANEYERPIVVPNMGSSHDMIGSYDVWEIEKFKGEGTVVAIIDSGIDPSHKDMVLSETTEPKLSEEDVNAIKAEKGLPGKFHTKKVPYGYNYYDLNDEVRDLGPDASMHGMHVAGTVGANGTIKGVAPESQLLAMKVFSNDPIYATTFSDIWLKAIEDSIKLGADVINMSLGSTAGFYREGSPEDVAITNAVENGIVCSISAGNSARFGYGWDEPWKQNPDTGVVGTPGLNTDSIQVASVDNIGLTVDKVSYKDGEEEKEIGMMISGDLVHSKVIDGEVEFEVFNLGKPEEFEGIDLTGKVALIKRGDIAFGAKVENAQKAGAIAVIIDNNAPGVAGMNLSGYEIKVPVGMISNSDGVILRNLAEKKISFPAGKMSVPNAAGGLMSYFTSWGTTPSLELKPEITAPGGNIYSTFNNNTYGFMSGTSMAAPHVAGGSAIVMQYLKQHEEYKDLTSEEQARLAKVLLMNTAEPVIDETNTLVSPRRQGAGLMNLLAAVNTPVRVVNPNTNEAKVELKDFTETRFTFDLKAINDSDEDITYIVDVAVLADNIEEFYITNARELSAEVEVVGGNEITVPANSSKEFTIKVDFTYCDGIYKNMFVDGFVRLFEKTDSNPSLVVPFVGFHGEWDEPAILDGMYGIDGPANSYYGAANMMNFDGYGNVYWYEYNKFGPYAAKDTLFMNPGTEFADEDGTGAIMPYLTFLRNAENVSYNILDADGNLLRTIYKENFVRKHYYDEGSGPKATLKEAALWDGTVRGKVVPDGQYYYEIAANIHYPDADVQSKKISITIDTKGPEISDIKYDPETGKLTWKAEDNGAGLRAFVVFVNDYYAIVNARLDGGKVAKEYGLNIESLFKDLGANYIDIVAFDNLYNESYGSIEYITDNNDAYIFLYKPELLVTYNEPPVIANPDMIEELPINSIIVEDKAYDQEYAATNTMAQLHILFNDYMGRPIYVKTSRTEAMDLDGNIIDLYDLPEIVRYYDADGVITYRYTVVEEPEVLEGVGIEFSGYVANFVALDKILIDGEEVDFYPVYKIELEGTLYEEAYEFSKELRMDDGYKEVKITAISKTGKESSIVRRFWVDNTSPTLEFNVLDIDHISGKATIEVIMKDNMGYLELYMFDNYVYDYEYNGTYEDLGTHPSNETFTIEVDLEEGDNTFEFTLYDIAGNKTVKEITVTRTVEEAE